jgi:hypothetical protein
MAGLLQLQKGGLQETARIKDSMVVASPKGFRELIRGFHDLLRQKPLSLDTVRVESISVASNNAIHTPDFRGEDGSIVELDVVSLVDTEHSYS